MENFTLCNNVTLEMLRSLTQGTKSSDEAGDATWILTSAFIIFTMQSGFGLLEAGSVSVKSECNIMVKNAVDVIFGGLGYWMFGFAFSYGKNKHYSNGFTGFGNFLGMEDENDESGELHAKYFFQLSFATTATTIVSGAMAERTNLKAYMFLSFINTFSYVFPAHWVWADDGWLRQLGVVDVAGCGPVHIVGGAASLVATMMLKPRLGMFKNNLPPPSTMASPTNVVLGTFMLWWGWLGFNCGSTFGVNKGKWKLASRAAVTTVNASIGGGIWSVFYCYMLTKRFNGKLNVGVFTGSILGGLVSVTGICALCTPWEALIIGVIGGAIVCYGMAAMQHLKVDDPVSCVPVHLFCGIWGLVCVGLFCEKDKLEFISKTSGIFRGGPFVFLGYQCLAVITIAGWSMVTSAIELYVSDLIFGLRMNPEAEKIGADVFEHGIQTEWDSCREKIDQRYTKRASTIFGRNLTPKTRSNFRNSDITCQSSIIHQKNITVGSCNNSTLSYVRGDKEMSENDLRYLSLPRTKAGIENHGYMFRESDHTEMENLSLANSKYNTLDRTERSTESSSETKNKSTQSCTSSISSKDSVFNSLQNSNKKTGQDRRNSTDIP